MSLTRVRCKPLRVIACGDGDEGPADRRYGRVALSPNLLTNGWQIRSAPVHCRESGGAVKSAISRVRAGGGGPPHTVRERKECGNRWGQGACKEGTNVIVDAVVGPAGPTGRRATRVSGPAGRRVETAYGTQRPTGAAARSPNDTKTPRAIPPPPAAVIVRRLSSTEPAGGAATVSYHTTRMKEIVPFLRALALVVDSFCRRPHLPLQMTHSAHS
jgi:hypothetical protein